jgi:hypothetical protein
VEYVGTYEDRRPLTGRQKLRIASPRRLGRRRRRPRRSPVVWFGPDLMSRTHPYLRQSYPSRTCCRAASSVAHGPRTARQR